MKFCRSQFALAWLILGLHSLSAAIVPEDEYLVDAWDTDRGLPHSTVTSIAQTPDGYLWVGTLHGGLARFDGVRFVTFHPGNTSLLPSIEIQRLLVDPAGTLWIGVVEGTLLSHRDGAFQFERTDPQTPFSWLGDLIASHTNEIVFSSTHGWIFRGKKNGGTNYWETIKPPGWSPNAQVCQDSDGIFWYRRKNARLGRIQRDLTQDISVAPGLKHQQINALERDRDGRIWVATPLELAVWDGSKFVDAAPTNGPHVNAIQLAAGPDGGMWVYTGDSIRKCLNGEWATVGDLRKIDFSTSQRGLKIYPDSQGGAWLMKPGVGLWYVSAAGRVVHIGIEQGLPSNLLECWLEDREGNVWVGLSGGGLACIHKRTFHTLWPSRKAEDLAARSVCEDKEGNLWFGTSGEKILRWSNGEFTEWIPPRGAVMGVDSTVCPDATGRIWVGTVQNGIWLIETNLMRRPFDLHEAGTVARVLYHDHAGRIWIGNEFGLYCWENQRLRKFTTADGFANAYVLAITEDRSGTLWLGTAAGELRSYKDGKFTTYRPADSLNSSTPALSNTTAANEPAEKGHLSGGERFWSLLVDREGVIWIGTLGGGLLRFKDGQFVRYTTQQGLPNEHVSQILEDTRGRLWLGTRGGIARAQRSELERYARGETQSVPFVTYGKFDGLPTIECSGGYQPSCWAGTDGRLWFTTVKGAIWVDPKKIPFNPLPPPVLLEELRVDKQLFYAPDPGPRLRRELSNQGLPSLKTPGQPLRIAAGQHFLEFKFTALSFVSPDKVRFRWRLWSAEREWTGSGAERGVSYSYLPPGNYQFLVQACNNDGVWNEEGASLALVVLPYFWQTWWFRTCVVLLIASLLFAGYSIRIARVRELGRLRLRIARDLHDEVGADLGSISLLAEVMEEHPNAEDARHIRGIVSQTVDTLRDIVWFIDPTHEHLSDLVARMAETAKTMLTGIRYDFEQSGDFRSASLPLDFRRNIIPIFKEALHNATKHSHATRITIQVNRSNNRFQFTVRDNGQGFDPRITSSGNGLKNMPRRAAEMNATLEIVSAPNEGTTLTLTANIP